MEDKQDKIELLKNKLIIIVLTLLAIFLFFKVYVYFSKPINIVLGALFPFVLSFVIVYCLMPFIDLLNHKFKMRRKLAILIVLTIFVLIFGYITFTLVPLVIKQLSGLINYFIENQTAIQTRLSDFLSTNNIDLKETVIKSKEVIFNNILGVLNFSVSFLTGIFSLLFMTPVFTIMLIFSFDSIEKGLRNTLIKLRKQEVLPLLKSIDEAIGKYVKVTVLDCLIIGIESYILFSYLKLPYVQLFALIIGIGNLIPFIGTFIGLVPVLIYAITQSWSLFLIILVVITILQGIEANIVKPLLTSKSVDIHPITTLLTVLVGGALLGIPGAFLAIPIYMVIKLSIQFLYNRHEEKIEKS